MKLRKKNGYGFHQSNLSLQYTVNHPNDYLETQRKRNSFIEIKAFLRVEEIVEIFMYFIKDILLPQNRNARSINFVQISKCLAYNYNYMSHTPSYNQSNIFRVQIKEKKVSFCL